MSGFKKYFFHMSNKIVADCFYLLPCPSWQETGMLLAKSQSQLCTNSKHGMQYQTDVGRFDGLDVELHKPQTWQFVITTFTV